ncbi:MAG: ABC transporter permease [Lentisphaerae bacterium]|nr:ABC transporter permease [Lentisphaerota bacterium]
MAHTAYDLSKAEFEVREGRLRAGLCRAGRHLLSLGLMVAVWYALAGWVRWQRGVEFPTPGDCLGRLVAMLRGEKLYGYSVGEHVLSSFLRRWLAGYLLAVAAGLGLGLVVGVSRRLHEVMMPLATVIQLIPGLAWVPIALLLFGIGNTATVFMIFITALVPIIINTAGGIEAVPDIYCRAARMMGASWPRVFCQVMLPAALPAVVNGLRIGFANGWRVLIAAEMVVGVGLGLGYAIIQARWSLDFEAAFVCIAIICAVGLVFEKVVFAVIERRITERTRSD